MSDAEKTLVTVATYNEMENLPRLVEEIFALRPRGRFAGDRRQLARRHRPLVRPPGGGRRPASAACTGRANWGWARPSSPA